jgi:hypothetical protein
VADRLKYSLLDDLELAYAHGIPPPKGQIDLIVTSLGPIIQLSRSPAREFICDIVTMPHSSLSDAAAFMDRPDGMYLSKDGSVGISTISADGELALELMQRGLMAINRSGLPRAAAAQAVSALGELDSNVFRHSGDKSSGLIAYEVCPSFVGIYASDQGCGVLSSLKQNPAYASVEDEGEAISLALREGVSSSTDKGRGMGFRPIFVGLAAHCGLLRFRSGNAMLEMNGYGESRPTQEIKERAPVVGFHVFVHCTFGGR